jgi:hypothetical protein
MKAILIILSIILISSTAMGQNEHPMKIAMVSVFVEDPVKTDYGDEAVFDDSTRLKPDK